MDCLHSHTGWKMPGTECIHGNSWRQRVHSCPLPSSPNYFRSHPHPTPFYLLPDWRSGHHTHLPPRQVLGSWQMLPVLAFLLALVWRESPPKPMCIESMMPSNHLILCHPPSLLHSIFPGIRVFSNELALHIRWPK